ncbi:MAG: T9SS type A sorting domain-containing protein, partial [Chitinivibrionales bacterium]
MAFSITNTFKARMVLCCIALSFFVWTVSAQVLDTINGTVTDSASNAAIDSVNVSSEGVSVKTNASGVFSLVVGATQVINPLETKNMPAVNWDPKNGLFSWSGLSGNVSISVRDVSGRVVTRYISTQGPMKHEVSLADLPQGVFLAEIRLNNQTVAYKIFHFLGENGNSLKTVYQAPNSSVSFLAKGLVTTKSHVLIFSKSGYNSSTITVAAGTATGTIVKVKMVASGGGTIPIGAIDSVGVPASGSSVTFKTSLANGEVYLLKAIGAVTVGTDQEDAEFAGFGAGATGMDTVGGVDVGIDIGTQKLRQNKTGREKWA